MSRFLGKPAAQEQHADRPLWPITRHRDSIAHLKAPAQRPEGQHSTFSHLL